MVAFSRQIPDLLHEEVSESAQETSRRLEHLPRSFGFSLVLTLRHPSCKRGWMMFAYTAMQSVGQGKRGAQLQEECSHQPPELIFVCSQPKESVILEGVSGVEPEVAATTRLRQSALAWYWALSAAVIRSFKVPPWVG